MGLLVSIGHVTTTRTRVPYVVATIGNHLWLGQVGNRGHPFSGIGSIRTRTKHGFALLVLMLEPQGYDKGSSGAILKPGKDAIVSAGLTISSLMIAGNSLTITPALALTCTLSAMVLGAAA